MVSNYDVYLIDYNEPNKALCINNVSYEDADKISYDWCNNKTNRDYFYINTGEKPVFLKQYNILNVDINQLNNYM